MIVLGIETSCDETGIAIYDSEHGLLSHVLHSQVALHADYGGVVPELASRDHIRYLLPLIRQALAAGRNPAKSAGWHCLYRRPGADRGVDVGCMRWAVAWPGRWAFRRWKCTTWKAICWHRCWKTNPPEFPFIALLVSGGHTLLAQVEGVGRYEILGQSLDDAAGEAFDKTAKMLGLGYPGGPALAKLAKQGTAGRV